MVARSSERFDSKQTGTIHTLTGAEMESEIFLSDIKSAKRIESSPWHYVLYEINNTDWVLEVVRPNGIVDLELAILLSAEEKKAATETEDGVSKLADSIKANWDSYVSRRINPEAKKKYSILLILTTRTN